MQSFKDSFNVAINVAIPDTHYNVAKQPFFCKLSFRVRPFGDGLGVACPSSICS